jgi:uncharacterized protein (UPF0218 family)
MVIKANVLAEEIRQVGNVEYVSVTCMEFGANPLLQMFDYGLRGEESSHKGKLVGKTIEIQVTNIPMIFSGRPKMNGRLLSVGK